MELNASDLFALELTDYQIDLQGLTKSVRRRAVSLMHLLEAELVRDVRSLHLDDVSSPSVRRRRIERLIRDVRSTLTRRYDGAERETERGLNRLSEFSRDSTVNVVNTVFTVDIAAPTITRADLKALVKRDVVLGEPAADWWAGESEGTRRRFAREMRLGILRGETTDELVRRVRGKATGRTINVDLGGGRSRRVKEYRGGVLDLSRSRTDALVRTSAQSVANGAQMEVYKGNLDLIRGYGALTTLDDRTSPTCIARTGAVWSVDGEPLPESTRDEPFPGPPPWHFRCRSSVYPITYSWDELMKRTDGRRRRRLDTVPNSVRATMDGLVGTGRVRTFDQWLRIKGDAFASRKLGPGVFDLWKSKRITLSQLLDANGDQRTLAQLAQL